MKKFQINIEKILTFQAKFSVFLKNFMNISVTL